MFGQKLSQVKSYKNLQKVSHQVKSYKNLKYTLEATFSLALLIVGHNVCCDDISHEFGNESCRVKN